MLFWRNRCQNIESTKGKCTLCALEPVIYPIQVSEWWSIFSLSTFRCVFIFFQNYAHLYIYVSYQKGGIQQLRGPNFTQFCPPTPFEWQKWTLYILSTLCHVTHRGLSTDPPPPSSCPRTYWMPPKRSWYM